MELTEQEIQEKIDAAIKGVSQDNPEQLVQQAIASFCGRPLFAV